MFLYIFLPYIKDRFALVNCTGKVLPTHTCDVIAAEPIGSINKCIQLI